MEALLIGVDAGCLPVFNWLRDGRHIPTIESLCTTGVSGPLTSQIPPCTPSAWPAIYTGVNPGKHGVFGYVDYDGYDWRVVDTTDVRESTLWELLDYHGLRSVVVNAPVTHPAPPIDGAIVPGYVGPEFPTCHPEGLLDEIRTAVGPYRVYPPVAPHNEGHSAAETIEAYTALIRTRGETFRYLTDEFDPDFGFVQFQLTDTVFQTFDGDWGAVEAVYRATDQQIGETIEATDPKRIFLTSDHGIGPCDGYELRLNQYLAENGFVSIASGGTSAPSWSLIQDRLRRSHERPVGPGLIERVAGTASDLGVGPDHGGSSSVENRLGDVLRRYLPIDPGETAGAHVDSAASIAYLRAPAELGVRINLEGREPDGVVPPAEYESVRGDLIRKLSALSAPDGTPIFESVLPREEVVHGPYAEEAVDVFTIPNEFDHNLSADLPAERFSRPTGSWSNKRRGVFAAKGVGIDESARFDGAHLFDVAPTILASMGIPISDRMDGTARSFVPMAQRRPYPKDGSGDPSDGDERAGGNGLRGLSRPA